MQQIHRRAPMQKCDFNEIALWHRWSPVNFLYIFRTLFPSSHLLMFYVNVVLKNFTKLIRKLLCWSHFFIKLLAYWKVTPAQVFSCEFYQIFRNTFFAEYLWIWLLKCCKTEKSYDIKIYFYSIKANLYSMKYIFNKINYIFLFIISKYVFIQSKWVYIQ